MSAVWERLRKNPWNWIILVVLIVITWAVYLPSVEDRPWPEWTGFGQYTGDLPAEDRGKTLWDWLELLIIPAILGFGAILFNRSQRINEQRLAVDQHMENALQSYLDNIVELLLKGKLLENKDIEHDPTVDVARLRTIITLRILNTERKNVVFRFLRDANLADFILRGASLGNVELPDSQMHNISLQAAEMHHANLSGASMREADLRGTRLWAANLSSANLSRARLNDANLSEANLRKAKLMRANLSGANIKGADLSGADLTDASVTNEQLASARSLEGAIMPDGTKYAGQINNIEKAPPHGEA